LNFPDEYQNKHKSRVSHAARAGCHLPTKLSWISKNQNNHYSQKDPPPRLLPLVPGSLSHEGFVAWFRRAGFRERWLKAGNRACIVPQTGSSVARLFLASTLRARFFSSTMLLKPDLTTRWISLHSIFTGCPVDRTNLAVLIIMLNRLY